jgi:hypothetical protein
MDGRAARSRRRGADYAPPSRPSAPPLTNPAARFKLATFVQYVPLPVVGGYLGKPLIMAEGTRLLIEAASTSMSGQTRTV